MKKNNFSLTILSRHRNSLLIKIEHNKKIYRGWVKVVFNTSRHRLKYYNSNNYTYINTCSISESTLSNLIEKSPIIYKKRISMDIPIPKAYPELNNCILTLKLTESPVGGDNLPPIKP